MKSYRRLAGYLLVSLVASVLFCLTGCGKATVDKGKDGIVVFVTIPPMQEAVQRIGGNAVDVQVLVPPGMSPETYSPDASKVMALGKAAAFFAIGVPCEQALLPKLHEMFPDLAIVKTQKNMRLRAIGGGPWAGHGDDACGEYLHEHEHHDVDGGHHHHFGADPHVWLDIDNMICFAECVAEQLGRIQPENAAAFSERANAYKDELKKLKLELQEQLKPLNGETLLVFHPAYGYFFDMFGIKQLAIEQDGKEATGAHLVSVLATARQKNCTALIIQPQQNARTASLVAQELENGHTIVLDPLFQEYISGMRQLARSVAAETHP